MKMNKNFQIEKKKNTLLTFYLNEIVFHIENECFFNGVTEPSSCK